MSGNVTWIWFQLMFGIGTRRSHALMEYFPNPADIIDGIEKRTRVLSMLREEELLNWKPLMERAAELERRTLRKGCDIITPDHSAYPPLLRDIFAPPAALYVKGDLECLNDTLVIAMVGTRAFTEYGRDAAAMLAGKLAERGVTVVSGLAKGIDTICHTAALKAGGKSIGVLGCGIDVDYPKGSSQLKRELCQNGAVVSEYPLGTEPLPSNFPMRNRVISGMADGVIVVEADLKSGSMITAYHALEQNRELFAVPGSIFEVREQGTHKLIQEGAKLTGSAEDVFEEFEHRTYKNLKTAPAAHKTSANGIPKNNKPPELPDGPAPVPVRQELPEELTDCAKEVYALITSEPVSFENIAEGCGFGIGEIQSALTELEIYGLISGYPGRRFSL